ncbi:hypothetical protein [Natrialba asiatica]|uniref:Small CPxCG-related zinc finger protein n=1 Tax=Natrialba asiatica (strain ATCC 700177 / DSM 12278 / JCM 9576 / FERM P-10747 / NBRC 102637 / 172P1) TaxID=29540 RepID=M0AT33_NATA1|nr:hypothetical protein [Natrialba asiatica]ELZ01710.1 hypothetical protein C481_09327 [Natrialba asiatica DSM 12278]
MINDANDTADSGNEDDTGHPDRLAQCELPRCPRCDRPVAQTTMLGPGEAVASPCGCRVAPPDPDRPGSD